MTGAKKLVIGASGFVGSHVTRQLVDRGDDAARIALRRDIVLSSSSVRLMHIWPTLDHGKAERELGWQPEPIHDSVRRAAHFYHDNRKRRSP